MLLRTKWMSRLSSGLWYREIWRIATDLSESSAVFVFTSRKWVARVLSKRRYLPLWLQQSRPKCHSENLYCWDKIIKIISTLTFTFVWVRRNYLQHRLTYWQIVQGAERLWAFVSTVTNLQFSYKPETSWPTKWIKCLRKNLHGWVLCSSGLLCCVCWLLLPAFREMLLVTSSTTK
jgi:hypothetical protein